MDEMLRSIERAAASGDPHALARLRHARCRAGNHCGCSTPIGVQVNIEYALNEAPIETSVVGITGIHPVDTSGEWRHTLTISVALESEEANIEALSKIAERLGIPIPDSSPPIKRPCPYCKVGQDQPCITFSGRKASKPHVARWSAMNEGRLPVHDRSTRYDPYYEPDFDSGW